MERQEIERCLEQVAAYRASGQKAKDWAAAHGVRVRTLAGWCAHAGRWQARLKARDEVKGSAKKVAGFVAARVPALAAVVRVEIKSGYACLDLHWPVGHAMELAAWVKELGR